MQLITRTAQRGERVQQVPLGDGRVTIVRRRVGSGIPVVLLHGLLDSSRGWSEICARLDGPTIAMDLAGFGSSSQVSAPCLDAYADDVASALGRLRLGRFVLVGHSLGGAVATAVAERMSDDVAALVLLAPAGFGRIPLAEAVSLPVVREVIDRLLPLALGRPALVGAAYRVGVSGGPAPEPSLVATLAREPVRLSASARHAVDAIVAAGVAADGFHRRRVGYDGPVHVVWGDRDRVVPLGHLPSVEAAFAHPLPQVWEGMGHHHQREESVRLVRLVEHVRAAASLPSLTAARRSRWPSRIAA